MNRNLTRPKLSQTQRYTLIGVAFGILFPAISTVLKVVLSPQGFSLGGMVLVQKTDPLLWVIDSAPIFLGFFASLAGRQTDRVLMVNQELRDRENDLKNIQLNLEQEVKNRTSALDNANQYNERRARQFEAIGQVSRTINKARSLQDLLPQITEVISQQFNFYHVGIFLVDETSEYALLVASNSEGGKRMLARRHKLLVGQEGIVGNVAGLGTPRIALDTGKDAFFFNNPDLPETRSEMSLPLFREGDRVFGVLDVQSIHANAFGQDDIQVLTTLADQVSIAIANARLFEETQKSLLESETLYRRDIRKGWAEFSRSEKIAGIRRSGMKGYLLKEPLTIPGSMEVSRSGNIYVRKSERNDPSSETTIPMKLRGEVVGLLNIKTNDNRTWTNDDMDIILAIIERAALSVENARLLAESQRRANREQTISQISAKIGGLVNIENIVQTAIQELGNTLPNTDIAIQFNRDQETE